MNSNSSFAQSYEEMWKKVEALVNEDKPKSVIKQAEQIYAKAQKEDSFVQMLRAKMCITEKQCDLDPELFQPSEYENMIPLIEQDSKLTTEQKVGRTAVIHCLVASAYCAMMDSYVHDFDEETCEQFPAKAKEHCLAALSDMQTLSQIDNTQYMPIITQREDSRLFNHDLLNVLLSYILPSRKYEFSEEERIPLYERAIKVYEENNNRNAATLLRLKVLNMRKSSSLKSLFISHEDYLAQLNLLHDATQDIEAGADVDVAIANAIYNQDDQLAFVRKAQEKWKDSERCNEFKNIESNIFNTHIGCSVERNILTDKPFKLDFSYNNAKSVTLTVRYYAGTKKDSHELLEKGDIIVKRDINFPLTEDSQQRIQNNLPFSGRHTDSMCLPAGHYVFIAEANGEKEKQEVQITSIRAISLTLPDSTLRVTVLDNETGRPVSGASVLCFYDWSSYGKAKPAKSFRTNSKGEAIVPYLDKNGNQLYWRIAAVRDESKYGKPNEDLTNCSSVSTYRTPNEKRESTIVKAFSDRSIYRPGQTVHLSAIVYKQLADQVDVVADRKLEAFMESPDGERTKTQYAQTNDMGSASFTFDIPADCKLGSYSIRVSAGSSSEYVEVRIEEYKRPTFEVIFDEEKNHGEYVLDSLAHIQGEATMFSGSPVQGAKVNYIISWAGYSPYRWYATDWNYLHDGETTTLDSGNFIIDVPTSLPEIVTTDSISFRIHAEVTDVNGEMQSAEYTFKVKNPNYTPYINKDEGPKDELKLSSLEISETQDVVVTFTAKESDAPVHYLVMSKHGIEDEGIKVLNGDELKFTIKYKKKWGDGAQVRLFYVRNGHLYQSNEQIKYVRPDKRLNLSWRTFRDHLQPGQKEEWVLTVKDSKGRVVNDAELLAVMYDASLDNIYPHDWSFAIHFDRQVPYFHLSATDANSGFYTSLSPRVQLLPTHTRFYDAMKEFEHQRWYRIRYARHGSIRLSKASATYDHAVAMCVNSEAMAMSVAEPMTEAVAAKQLAEPETTVAGNNPSGQPAKTLRTNLTELAFFAPHIMTDANGEAHISFTLPDCLTEWKFMGIVHTKDLHNGTITANATAKKDFMVQPNMPRFLRTGDKAIIAAKVINMTERTIKGKATLRLINAETETVIATVGADFNVNANQTTSVTFPLEVNMSAGDYICEITGTDGISTDGEQNRLPILSTRVDVVESVPFYLTDAGTKNVDMQAVFNKNSDSATDRQLTISYTDNPALLVFKQLQAVQNPEHDNAPCFAAALYSNLVLLDMSKVLGDRLEKFDAAAARKTADKALEKLIELQLGNGGWTWFKGMQPSYYITLTVAEHLDRLLRYMSVHNAEAPSEVKSMLKKALKYLDKETLDSYKWKKKHLDRVTPSNSDLAYLSICTDPNKEMLDVYLKEMVNDFRNLTIYGRADGSLILRKYGREKEADKFLESVKEYTMFKEGFGRYYATDQAYYSWMDYRIPTQLAAMRAIQKKDGVTDFMLDMQLWLLRQKQTQLWRSSINSIDVADFLLTLQPDVALHEVTTPTLVLDGKDVKQDSVIEIAEPVKTLTVTKTSPGISWGYARATFQEEVSRLESYTTGELNIERKVIRNGNKVTIRLIIHADRDMDFVTVKSQHPACLEPLRSISGYQWLGGRGAYLEVHDSYVNIFFDRFTRGTTTVDTDYYIARDGDYNTGFASVECTYAPDFGAHTSGEKLNITK